MIDKEQIKKQVLEQEDYIKSTKYSNSLSKVLQRYPDGVDNRAIARLLMMEPEEVEKIYNEAVEMLKDDLDGK